MRAYLDSSAIVKRYIKETGSDTIDDLYHRLERGRIDLLVFSSWNVGEVFGAIDSRFQRGDLTEEEMLVALKLFTSESRKFVALRKLRLVPLGARILNRSRQLLLKYHIYQADALQLESARLVEADYFISADKKLLDCALSEKFAVFNPEKKGTSLHEGEEVKEL
jgi:predicted nucleic acid-binding protein